MRTELQIKQSNLNSKKTEKKRRDRRGSQFKQPPHDLYTLIISQKQKQLVPISFTHIHYHTTFSKIRRGEAGNTNFPKNDAALFF